MTSRATVVLAALLFTASAPASARPIEECQQKWGQAARSYMNGQKTDQVSDDVFKAACEMESKGDKENARAEAVRAAAAALQKVDGVVCERFLKNFIGIEDAAPVCSAASGDDVDAARKAVAGALPPPSKGKGKKK